MEAKRRELGVTFSQVARYLGWDEGTLTRYLNGTWRIPPNRSAALEEFLSALPEGLGHRLQALPRRTRRS